MKEAFLTHIFITHRKDAQFDKIFKTAVANGYKMFCFNGSVYSTEVVIMRTDKTYATFEEAVLFKLSDLITT